MLFFLFLKYIYYMYNNAITSTLQVQLKFYAPQKPGLFQYSVNLKSDSYFDFDLLHNIKVSDIIIPHQVSLEGDLKMSDVCVMGHPSGVIFHSLGL